MIDRQPNTQYVASISRGKDSNAMLHVIKDMLHYPLDRIVTAQVWATQDIPAELPPMVAWQDECDRKILDMFGVPVERVSAKDADGVKMTYERKFYETYKTGNRLCIYGFPFRNGNWCESRLKELSGIYNKNDIRYIGIAADEPERIKRHGGKKGIVMPLVDAGWTKKMCYEWCADNGLLAPTYTTSMRDGCWFCHNQGVAQLRNLRHNYPDLWALLMQWDTDSPVPFKADGHTVHDFDARFQLEDEGLIDPCARFKWDMLENQQISMDMILKGAIE